MINQEVRKKKQHNIEITGDWLLYLVLAKAREVAPANSIFVFCGDGVSDISAARKADVLFARNGRDLVTYCERHEIPYIGFDSFEEIEKTVVDIVEGKLKVVKDEKTGFSKVVPV